MKKSMKSKENGKTYNLGFIADRLAGKQIEGIDNEAVLAQLPADVRAKAERLAARQAREDAYADAHVIVEGVSIRDREKKMKTGSANFESALNHGEIVGTPRFAGYTPHHQRHSGGAWTYENVYSPAEEMALAWLNEGRDILIEDVWVVWPVARDSLCTEDDDLVHVRKTRGATIEDVMEITAGMVHDVSSWDTIGESECEWYSATICMVGTPEDYRFREGIYGFQTNKARNQFIEDVRAERRDSEEK